MTCTSLVIRFSPVQCPTSECRGRTFTPLRSSPLTQTIDWQTIRVQEISGDDRREAGRIPRTIERELTADLVDSCVPGDMVTITAVVKVTGSEEGELRVLWNPSNADTVEPAENVLISGISSFQG